MFKFPSIYHKESTHAVVKTKQGKVTKENEIKTKEQKTKQFFENVVEEFEVP